MEKYGVDPNTKSHVRLSIYAYTIHFLTIYVCMLQNGLQPIHHAAQEGREDIVMILVDDFNVKPDAVTFV